MPEHERFYDGELPQLLQCLQGLHGRAAQRGRRVHPHQRLHDRQLRLVLRRLPRMHVAFARCGRLVPCDIGHDQQQLPQLPRAMCGWCLCISVSATAVSVATASISAAAFPFSASTIAASRARDIMQRAQQQPAAVLRC